MEHRAIDERSLMLARAVVERIDADPQRQGLHRARAVCQRWGRQDRLPAVQEWSAILQRSWPEVRRILLDPSEEGRRLRQSDPFCGILTPRERWSLYREFARHEAK